MRKVPVFLTLIIIYIAYSGWVYTAATGTVAVMNEKETAGKELFEVHNCESCHQLFGLGGYLGPELTTIISDRNRGPLYAAALLKTGGGRMPDFHFTDAEIEALLAYLGYVDRCATTYKTASANRLP